LNRIRDTILIARMRVQQGARSPQKGGHRAL
jgi:hypothetical protein